MYTTEEKTDSQVITTALTAGERFRSRNFFPNPDAIAPPGLQHTTNHIN